MFTEKKIKTTLKHMDRCSALFMINEMYIKIYPGIPFSLIWTAEIEKVEDSVAGHIHMCIPDRSINQYHLYGK